MLFQFYCVCVKIGTQVRKHCNRNANRFRKNGNINFVSSEHQLSACRLIYVHCFNLNGKQFWDALLCSSIVFVPMKCIICKGAQQDYSYSLNPLVSIKSKPLFHTIESKSLNDSPLMFEYSWHHTYVARWRDEVVHFHIWNSNTMHHCDFRIFERIWLKVYTNGLSLVFLCSCC